MKSNRNLWPWGIVAFFVLLIAGLATLVIIAATHREYLVSETYYEQELKFQNQIDSAARTKFSGAAVALNAAGTSLVITLPPAQVAQKLSGSIEFYRPSAPDLDRQLPLTPLANGTQKLDVSQLASGLWVARVKWNAAGQDYFLEQKITVAGK